VKERSDGGVTCVGVVSGRAVRHIRNCIIIVQFSGLLESSVVSAYLVASSVVMARHLSDYWLMLQVKGTVAVRP
jgi:hypothetical protein